MGENCFVYAVGNQGVTVAGSMHKTQSRRKQRSRTLQYIKQEENENEEV